MGLLKKGKPLNWNESMPYLRYVKQHGVAQFLKIYEKMKDRIDEDFKWGDEVEYIVVEKDAKNKKVYLSLRGPQILNELQEKEDSYLDKRKQGPPTHDQHSQPQKYEFPDKSSSNHISNYNDNNYQYTNGSTLSNGESVDNLISKRNQVQEDQDVPTASWRPEYAAYMLEGTPFEPYDSTLNSLLDVEKNMIARRKEAQKLLKPNEQILSLTMFPHLGVNKFTLPWNNSFENDITQSHFIPDFVISPHPRFGTLTRNIRLRRGEKVCILVPLYMDENTDKDIGTKTNTGSLISIPTQNTVPSIYMDAMAFGMGCCCLQVTFLARDILEARHLCDQLAVLAPIMLAMSASTSIVRGLLADTDVRWNIVSASVDDRYLEERQDIPKSRYDSISLYIGPSDQAKQYSDLNAKLDKESYETLLKAGVDDILAKHIAHLFIRDPLVVFTDSMEVNDDLDSEHFENIQSTNWQTVRFKPPPPNNPSIGWRVEFRVLEAQITDFENAAFAVFMALVSRAILAFSLNLYMPLSKVDENMSKAHKRNAVINESFAFRKNISTKKVISGEPKYEPDHLHYLSAQHDDAVLESFTIDEIINGSKERGFVGFVNIVHQYMDRANISQDVRTKLNQYVSFISKRASGEFCTNATFLRNFVLNHPCYKKDSVVTDEIHYDLIEKISSGSYEAKKPSLD